MSQIEARAARRMAVASAVESNHPTMLRILREWVALGHDLRCDWYMGRGFECNCGYESARVAIAKAEATEALAGSVMREQRRHGRQGVSL